MCMYLSIYIYMVNFKKPLITILTKIDGNYFCFRQASVRASDSFRLRSVSCQTEQRIISEAIWNPKAQESNPKPRPRHRHPCAHPGLRGNTGPPSCQIPFWTGQEVSEGCPKLVQRLSEGKGFLEAQVSFGRHFEDMSKFEFERLVSTK